jgi:hypothetical protein
MRPQHDVDKVKYFILSPNGCRRCIRRNRVDCIWWTHRIDCNFECICCMGEMSYDTRATILMLSASQYWLCMPSLFIDSCLMSSSPSAFFAFCPLLSFSRSGSSLSLSLLSVSRSPIRPSLFLRTAEDAASRCGFLSNTYTPIMYSPRSKVRAM